MVEDRWSIDSQISSVLENKGTRVVEYAWRKSFLSRNRPPHILIVEDDKNTREMFVEFTQMKITPRVVGVANVWSAIEYLNAHNPIDLVITDINLYFGRTDVVGMNGIELTDIIKRNWGIPVIVLTGYKPNQQKSVAIAAGASLFLAKPFGLWCLEASINQMLGIAI